MAAHTALQIQTALKALNIDPGPLDGKPGPKTTTAVKKFQQLKKLLVDGVAGPMTLAALFPDDAEAVMAAGPPPAPPPQTGALLPSDWLPNVPMKRIINHWTAGAHKVTEFDRKHYHFLVEDDGLVKRGIPSIALNDARGAKSGYAAHTLNCNTGSIGVSLACMAGAVENPFSSGSAPMTKTQWLKMAAVDAELCRRYGIPVTPQTVLTHAEVSANLGIPQRGKWDFTRYSWDLSVKGAKACGDMLRAAVRERLAA